jgi:hypothetical protein
MSVLEKVCRVKHDYSQQLVIPIEKSVSGRYRCRIFKDFTSFKKGQFEVRWITFGPDDLVVLSEVEKDVVMRHP